MKKHIRNYLDPLIRLIYIPEKCYDKKEEAAVAEEAVSWKL